VADLTVTGTEGWWTAVWAVLATSKAPHLAVPVKTALDRAAARQPPGTGEQRREEITWNQEGYGRSAVDGFSTKATGGPK